MDHAPDASIVYQAIDTLYGSDAVSKGNASVWLGELQKSIYAWQLSDRLLADCRDQVSCYFAAQTMRSKIQYSFQELPAESYESLRNSLIQHLSSGAFDTIDTNHAIVTQLCLALTDLYLQVPSWSGFLGDILNKFGSNTNSQRSTELLLVLLKVIPEEVDSRHLRLGANRRMEVAAELQTQTPAVLQFLTLTCQLNATAASEGILEKVFGCLSAWLTLPNIETDVLADGTLVPTVLQLLHNYQTPSRLHEVATECVVSALYKSENIKRHAKLAAVLQAGTYAMLEQFNLALANEDFDKLQSYSRLFVELAESLLESIIDFPGADGFGNMNTVELVLTVVGYHDYTLADMTFNWWYRLSEMIYQRNSPYLVAFFKPYVERLIIALYRHCRMDGDYDGMLEDTDEYAEFRQRATECLKDVIFIVGTDNCFKQMFEHLKSQGGNASWEETESALYIMTSIASNLLPDEDEVVPSVVGAVMALPDGASTHIALRLTAVRLLGQLSEWINQNPHSIEGALDWLLRCLNDVRIAAAVSDTLERLCARCGLKLQPHFHKIIAAVAAADQRADFAEEAFLVLLRATATILRELPAEEITARLNELCAMPAQSLSAILSQPRPPDGSAIVNGANVVAEAKKSHCDSSDPVVCLDRLAAVFRQFPSTSNNNNNAASTHHRPWFATVQTLWPLLSETLLRFEQNQRVVEHCCRTIRFVIRSLGTQSFPLVESLVNQMVDIYQRHQHSCFLYLGSVLVDEYGRNPALVTGLMFMLQSFCGPAFKLLDKPNGLRDNPDTVDDFFRLCIRFVQRSPTAFYGDERVKQIFDCAMVAISLNHQDANKSVTKFFTETMDYCSYCNKQNQQQTTENEAALGGGKAASELMLAYGPTMVAAVLQSALFLLPSHFVRDMAEILFCCGKMNETVLSEWLQTALTSLPSRGGLAATADQLRSFHDKVVGAKELRTVVEELRELIRLYR